MHIVKREEMNGFRRERREREKKKERISVKNMEEILLQNIE